MKFAVGRNHAFAERKHGSHGLQRARRAQRMAVHGLGGADRQLVRVRSENGADGPAFNRIVSRRAGAVRVDVTDLLRPQAASERAIVMAAAAPSEDGCVMWCASRGHADADNLAPARPCAPGRCTFQRLQHQHGPAFAENHALAVFGKGTAGIRGHHPDGVPGFQKPVS